MFVILLLYRSLMPVVQGRSWHLLTLIKLSPKIFLSRPEDLEAFSYVLSGICFRNG
jgi:hypothetical protein